MQSVKNTTGRFKDFLTYYLKTRFKFNIHSPFVYDFVDQVLEDEFHYKDYDLIESFREKYATSKEKILKTDYGSGSKKKRPRKYSTTIGKLLRSSAIDREEGRLLFRMIRYYQPEHILELGTSLGISTFYQGLGAGSHELKELNTLEGCPNIHKKAVEFRDELAAEAPVLNKINFINNSFDNVLPDVIDSMPGLDFVFFDGNHTRHDSLRYFEQCLKNAHENSIFIFDDIYHSRNMKNVWDQIKNHTKVRTTVDLFRLGIVFFNNPYAKQNFIVRF